MNLRDSFVTLVQGMLQGQVPSSLTPDSLSKAGLCAQTERQLTEQALGLAPGGWALYTEAGKVAARRGGVRCAATYEQAAINLGLRTLRPRFGDVLFYPWFDTVKNYEFGHMGMYVVVDGVEYMLENTFAQRGQLVFGPGPIRLTRLDDIARGEGAPRTIALPDARLAGVEPTLKATRKVAPPVQSIPATPEPKPAPKPEPKPAPAPAPKPGTKTEEVPAPLGVDAVVAALANFGDDELSQVAGALLEGRRYFEYIDGRQQPMLTIDKGSVRGDKFYLRLKTPVKK